MLEILAIVALTVALSLLGRVKRVEQRLREMDAELDRLRQAGAPGEAMATGRPAMVENLAPEAPAEWPEPMAVPPEPAPAETEPVDRLPADASVMATEPAGPPRPPRPPISSRVFEELFGSRLPIWAGGVTLAVAGFFLVKYSIDTGLLSPPIRVALALLFAGLLVAGAEAARRVPALARDPRVAQALAGAGIAVAYIAVLIATNLYALIGPLTAFLGLAAVTAAAIGLA
jgi:uncharacterized membrane protein